MPYFRRYRKNYRRNRKLTKTNIYLNRSARAQSKQINALNQKIKAVYKATRPETLTRVYSFHNIFTNSSMGDSAKVQQYSPWDSTNETSGDSPTTPHGEYARALGLQIRLMFQYNDNFSTSLSALDHDPSAGYRIIILQQKASTAINGTAPVTVENIVNVSQSMFSQSEYQLLAPLADGITSLYKVLFDKTYTISREHPCRSHRLSFKKLIGFSREKAVGSATSPDCRGRITILYITGGLHWDSQYSAQIDMTQTAKITYSDN